MKEKVLQHQQGSYILTVEAGRQLLLSADSRAEATLQAELTDVQERWKQTSIRLEQQKKELSTLLKVKTTIRQHVLNSRPLQNTLMAPIILAFVWTISIVCIKFYIDFLIIHQSLLFVVSVRTAF